MKKIFRIQLSLILAAALCCAFLMSSSVFARDEGVGPREAYAAEAEASFITAEASAPKSGELTLDPSSLTVPIFSGYFGVRIHAYIDGAEQSPFDITWTSSNPNVASVDTVGCVYASSVGTATITARAQNGRTAACSVTVVSNSNYPNVNAITYTQISELSYVDQQVGVGPLYGGQPVIIRRFRPSKGTKIDNPGSSPNANNGWAFTYATGFRFSAQAGHDYTIAVEPYAGQQDHDVEVFLSVYNSNFDLVSYAYSVHTGEYPTVNLHTTSSGYWYVVLTPVNLSNQWGNGYVKFKLTDPSAPPPSEWLLGDVDHNGIVNVVDSVTVLRHALGLITIPDDARLQADVTGDGSIDVTDALMILRCAMGLIDSFDIALP